MATHGSHTLTTQLRAICVFCGSAAGPPAHRAAATALGTLLGRERIDLVYGGAGVGLMRDVADAAMCAGARVVGVMPADLVARERAHPAITELRVVEGMAARKAAMADAADGCVVLPGGIGTLDELFEFFTAAYLGGYPKPIGICNVDGFFDTLLAFLVEQVAHGYLPARHHATLLVAPTPEAVLAGLRSFVYSTAATIEAEPRTACAVNPPRAVDAVDAVDAADALKAAQAVKAGNAVNANG